MFSGFWEYGKVRKKEKRTMKIPEKETFLVRMFEFECMLFFGDIL